MSSPEDERDSEMHMELGLSLCLWTYLGFLTIVYTNTEILGEEMHLERFNCFVSSLPSIQ